LRSVMSVTIPTVPTTPPSRPVIGLAETRPHSSVPSWRRKAQVVALAAGRRAADGALRAGARGGVEEVVDLAADQRAVLIAQQLGHALVDVGDETAVVRHPDALLGRVDQLLEALLAFLERAGSDPRAALASLEGGGVVERRPHQACRAGGAPWRRGR